MRRMISPLTMRNTASARCARKRVSCSTSTAVIRVRRRITSITLTRSSYPSSSSRLAGSSTIAAGNPAVVFNHVHARYADSPPSEAPQLDDVAFAVQQGDFVAITGGNGSGR